MKQAIALVGIILAVVASGCGRKPQDVGAQLSEPQLSEPELTEPQHEAPQLHEPQDEGAQLTEPQHDSRHLREVKQQAQFLRTPLSEVQRLVDDLVDDEGAFDAGIASKLVPHGEEAIATLLRAILERPEHVQYAYAHVLARINAEPARYEACRKLLNHSNNNVRRSALSGLVQPDSPREALLSAIRFAKGQEDDVMRGILFKGIISYPDPDLLENIRDNDPEFFELILNEQKRLRNQ